MAVNLKALSRFDSVSASNAGAWITIQDLENNPSELQIHLLGTDSDEWRALDHSEANLRMRANHRAGKPITLTSEQIEEKALRRIASVTKDWKGFPDESGNAAGCTPEAAYQVYKAFPHIARQVTDFVLEPANFGKDGEKVANPFDADAHLAEVGKF